jgi:glucose-1-phosphate thymidylyltransferase
MQAIILAGGYGTRLYPLTLNAPKPMIEIGEKPMIEYLIQKLQKLSEIHEIFIVSNNKFAHIFEEWLQKTNYKNIRIINDGTTSNEDRLGSIGDIQFVLDHADIHEDLMIIGGDNFVEDDFSNLVENFHKKWTIIGLYDVGDIEYVKQLWHPILDESMRIISLVEKPSEPTSSLASTLVYILKNSDLHYIKTVIENGKADRAGDLIAYLCQKESIYGSVLEGQWFDIGTMEQLKKAEEWIELKRG